jgi:hypothetical protein
MARLVRQGAITLTTPDGEVVQVYYDGYEPQPQLPMPDQLVAYEADVELLLQLPARIGCRARSVDAAMEMIETVLVSRTSTVPEGFSVTLQGDALERLGHRISIAAGAGMTLRAPGMTVSSVVDIHNIVPRGTRSC